MNIDCYWLGPSLSVYISRPIAECTSIPDDKFLEFTLILILTIFKFASFSSNIKDMKTEERKQK